MERLAGIWIDQSQAIVIVLEGERAFKIEIPSGLDFKEDVHNGLKTMGPRARQNISIDKKRENRHDELINKFLLQVMSQAKELDAFVIFGHGELKKQFKKMVMEDKNLSSGLLGVKTIGGLTQNQMFAWVKDYFNKTHVTIDKAA